MLTKKHFEIFARIIREDLDPYASAQPIEVRNVLESRRRKVAYRLADFCRAENNQFDSRRFFIACGIGDRVRLV